VSRTPEDIRAYALNASRAAAAKALAVPFEDRIAARTVLTETGCWEWTGNRYRNGYAGLFWQGKTRLAHRLTYEHFVGPIDEGLVIDHLCCNKACVNPAHLEPVTPRENTRRAMRSHCVNGHPFSDENTWMHKGKRYCRTCRYLRNKEAQERKRAA
jgi:hypothetical protein